MANTGPFLERDVELFAQLESTYAISPGALAGTDAFKHQDVSFEPVVARRDRNKDHDNAQASVLTTQVTRKSGKWSAKGELTPAGAATPTAPDIDNFVEAHFGSKHLAAAHTTTIAGSAGTDIVLVGGGVAASGIQVGDMVAIDQDGAGTYEARQVVTVGVGGTDHIAVDRVFTTANVATGRAVKVGFTGKLLQSAAKSLNIWSFLNGNNFRHQLPGAIVQNLSIDATYSGRDLMVSVAMDGVSQKVQTHSTSRPTPTTVGQPEVPTIGKVWLGVSLWSPVTVGFKSNNGLMLRENQGDSIFPSGVKRTNNNGRYDISQTLELLYLAGTPLDGDALYDNAQSLTGYDVIVQIGTTPGQMVVWRAPKWVPDVNHANVDGEVSLKASGRCYGTAGDDEITVAFL